MAFADLREWLTMVEKRGELLRLSGVSHELEMSGIAEVLGRESKVSPPATFFDDIPGFPKGFRTLFGMLTTPLRLALALGLPDDQLDRVSLVKNWRNKWHQLKPIPSPIVKSGPVLENVYSGKDVDLLKFPVPLFHEQDGGRYFGTAHGVITRDPDNPSYVNFGGYRNMLVDKNRIALHVQAGKDGHIMLRKYMERKKPMPVAIAVGMDPALWFMSITGIPYGASEYDYSGAIRGNPTELVEAPYTGLPVPARAELVVEGELHPDDFVQEGPFGEWNGYYCNRGLESAPEPVIRIKTVMHRNNPIFTSVCGGKPPHDYSLPFCMSKSGMIWDALDGCAVPGVAGVWCHEVGGSQLFNIISLKQAYAGHARQAALIASQCGGNIGRYTVVVDDDVDPSNLHEVMWVVATRADPERAIEVLRYCRSNNSDPAVPIDLKRKLGPHGAFFMSRAIIDACRPFDWKHEFYPIAQISPELRTKLLQKFDQVFQKWL
ncbi:MAG: UbiD family decarboxylase [Chloroflexota bacterium]